MRTEKEIREKIKEVEKMQIELKREGKEKEARQWFEFLYGLYYAIRVRD